MFITFFVIYLSYNIKTNKMNKLNLEKVNSKKQLEAQGYCRIDLNKGYWDYDFGKYVLVTDNDLYFETGGEMFSTTPVNTIKEALDIYNNGLFINI